AVTHPETHVERLVGKAEDVYHGVGPLRRFDRLLQGQLAAGVLRIGKQDDRSAPGLAAKLIVAREVNCVVQVRAAIASRWNRARRHHAAARDRVDLRAANGAFQDGRIFGEISQEVYVEVEAD